MSPQEFPQETIHLLDQLPVPIVLVAASPEVITYINPAFIETFPLSQADYLQQPLSAFLSTSACHQYHYWQVAKANPVQVTVKKCPLEITKRKKTLFQIIIIEPFQPDETLTQAHRDFLSTISHEFRTPLTSIKGFADTILKYGNQLEPDQQRRFVNIIRDQADRLIRMVEALLNVSKDGAQRLDIMFRPVPLQKLLERIAHSILIKSESDKSGTHPIVLDIPDNLPAVWADADRLEQVLTNLIDNAVKYSEANKTVTVRAHECKTLTSSDGKPVEGVAIDIIDEGIGIAEANLNKLFTQFYRVEGPLTQQVEGTGLGLYIAKSLTKAMNGEISVTSTQGKGSVFRVVFPIATLEKQAAYHRTQYAEDVKQPGYTAHKETVYE